jgi:protein-serine/threonine kinase
MQEVILKCLEVRAENRYQSAAQLLFALQNPDQVELTERAQRLKPSGFVRRVGRWWAAHGQEDSKSFVNASEQIARHAIVVAAVDIDSATPQLLEQLRETARRIVLSEPGARLACVSVMKTARIGIEELVDQQGRNRHVKQLVALQHWARPIGNALSLDERRLTCHVLEAPDVAAAIVDFSRKNQVDHIVMGARGRSGLRRYLGSVSSVVVAESSCTVTVVRAPGEDVSLQP